MYTASTVLYVAHLTTLLYLPYSFLFFHSKVSTYFLLVLCLFLFVFFLIVCLFVSSSFLSSSFIEAAAKLHMEETDLLTHLVTTFHVEGNSVVFFHTLSVSHTTVIN